MENNVKVGFFEQLDHFMKKSDTWYTAIIKSCLRNSKRLLSKDYQITQTKLFM